jgi:DNA-binding response OmpR family regulator
MATGDGTRILLVDDSETDRAIVSGRLRKAGYDVVLANDGREGLRALYASHPDLVLLDIEMPELDGWKTLELMREVSDVPVIMLTAHDTEIERVRGLRGGADDYVGKPFAPAELEARIEAVLRRTGGHVEARALFDDGVVRIDFAQREVTVRGEPATLTPLEFRLLGALTEHAGQVLSREQLLDLVWDIHFDTGGDQVKLYVRYLRRKLERDPARPELIETVRGFGYRYRKQR